MSTREAALREALRELYVAVGDYRWMNSSRDGAGVCRTCSAPEGCEHTDECPTAALWRAYKAAADLIYPVTSAATPAPPLIEAINAVLRDLCDADYDRIDTAIAAWQRTEPPDSGDAAARSMLASLIRQYHAEGTVSGDEVHGGPHARGAHPTCQNRWCIAATRALAAPEELDRDRLATALDATIHDYRGLDDLAAKVATRYAAAPAEAREEGPPEPWEVAAMIEYGDDHSDDPPEPSIEGWGPIRNPVRLAATPEPPDSGDAAARLADVRYIETTLIRSSQPESNEARYDESMAALSRIQTHLIDDSVAASRAAAPAEAGDRAGGRG